MHSYKCTCVYIHTYIYKSPSMLQCTHINTHRHTHIHRYMNIYVYTHIKTHMHIYMYVYICIHIHIYSYIYKSTDICSMSRWIYMIKISFCWNVLLCTLQCVAVCCSVIFAACRDGYIWLKFLFVEMCCYVRCSVLQCVAVCCSVIFAVCRDGYIYAYIYRSTIMRIYIGQPLCAVPLVGQRVRCMHVYTYTHKYTDQPLFAVPLGGQRVACIYTYIFTYIYTHIYTLYIRQCIFKVPVFCSRIAYM